MMLMAVASVLSGSLTGAMETATIGQTGLCGSINVLLPEKKRS
jgi:hypothetical protein